MTNIISGCAATDTVQVSGGSSLPVADAGNSNIINCNQSVVFLDGTASESGANITYTWTTIDGNILSGENTTTPLVDAAGDYLLTVTDTLSGCFANASTMVLVDTLHPFVDAGEEMTLNNCSAMTLALDGTNSDVGSNIFHLWTTMDGNILTGQNSLQPTVNQEGMYYLILQNMSNGCLSVDSVFVSENNEEPLADAGMDTLLTCGNTTLVLDATNSSSGINETYLWIATNGGIINANQNTLQPEITAAGTYELIIVDTVTGCMSSDMVEVGLDTNLPLVDAGQDMALNCNQSQVFLIGNNLSTGGVYTYEWTTPNGNILSN
ncbi:MAG TPA: PKD domain-containing protein, partial [Phaeodactylibacter sp.]|nr:PKD domain-containing protein [Phaeodactylibacter sp.]